MCLCAERESGLKEDKKQSRERIDEALKKIYC